MLSFHCYISEEQKSQTSKKVAISHKEKEFLLKTTQREHMTTKDKVLCEAAKQLYGQQYNQVVSTSAVSNSEVDVSDGEKHLLEKAISHFQKQMERCYFSISQMVYNMGKLGG